MAVRPSPVVGSVGIITSATLDVLSPPSGVGLAPFCAEGVGTDHLCFIGCMCVSVSCVILEKNRRSRVVTMEEQEILGSACDNHGQM